MKNTYLLLIIVAIIATSCGSQKMANPYSTSELIAHDTQGIVTLRGVSDEFKEEPQAEANAHKKAMQHLFYMGFPGTDMKNPMIQKGQRIETENKAFFDEFYKSGYKQYITSNKVDYYGCQNETKNCVTAASTFKLNYNLLRRDLERNKILNKIGF